MATQQSGSQTAAFNHSVAWPWQEGLIDQQFILSFSKETQYSNQSL